MKKFSKNEGVAVAIAIVVVLILFLVGSVILSPEPVFDETAIEAPAE